MTTEEAATAEAGSRLPSAKTSMGGEAGRNGQESVVAWSRLRTIAPLAVTNKRANTKSGRCCCGDNEKIHLTRSHERNKPESGKKAVGRCTGGTEGTRCCT